MFYRCMVKGLCMSEITTEDTHWNLFNMESDPSHLLLTHYHNPEKHTGYIIDRIPLAEFISSNSENGRCEHGASVLYIFLVLRVRLREGESMVWISKTHEPMYPGTAVPGGFPLSSLNTCSITK